MRNADALRGLHWKKKKMNDRELLKLAAKAAGFGAQNPPDNPHCWTESEYPKGSGQHGALWNYVGYSDTAELWNPLTDDGDALRLAVKLYMFDGSLFALFLKFRLEEVLNDSDRSDEEITRRAIVRAAAEIGRNMK